MQEERVSEECAEEREGPGQQTIPPPAPPPSLAPDTLESAHDETIDIQHSVSAAAAGTAVTAMATEATETSSPSISNSMPREETHQVPETATQLPIETLPIPTPPPAAPPAPEDPGSEEKATEPQTSVLGRLTVEQLLDYVKKQNVKVKKLKLENDEIRNLLGTATATATATEPKTSADGFWREIDSRPEWQRQLARGVCAHLLHSFQRPKNLLTQLRRAFLQWHRMISELHTSTLTKQLTEASETQTQLEQRVSKLKTLLARMHQSNQKNVEDSVMARKNQLEIALEYQQRMTQEEAERQALEEQLRCLAFESALHSDMEFMIEKAAQQIASQKTDNVSEASQAVKFFELQQQISQLETELAGSKELVQSYESRILHQSERILSLERHLERNKEIEEKSKLQISFLQNQSTELEIARQDLEVELKILVGNRTNVAAEIEARASAKASQMLKTLESNLNDTQAAMESWEKRALISESREERQNREIKILRKQVTDLQVIQSENESLVKLVREMKKSLQEPQGGAQHSVALSPFDATAMENERNILKKIQQESMLIVDRDTFQHLLRQAEMHERSLLSTSQHLTFFDNELHFLKKKSATYKDLLSTCHFLRAEQDQHLYTIFHSFSLNTLRNLDALLGFESLSNWEVTGVATSRDLLLLTSEPYRQKYNAILQNVENLDVLLLAEEGSNTGHEEFFSETVPPVLPSLFDHSTVVLGDDSSMNSTPSGRLISERYQEALTALRTQSHMKSLTAVYQRIVKKIKKTEQQLEVHSHNLEAAKASVEAASNAVSLCLMNTPGREPEEIPLNSAATLPTALLSSPVVTIYPHHLLWEAIDIEIPAGGMVTLPLPVPLLPRTSPKDSELLILPKELTVSWAIRSSSASYAQVAISAPAKSTPHSPHFNRLRSELISFDEVSRRGIQFGYVRSHEDVLSRIGESVVCGEHLIQTKDGNRMMQISNRAVWATITISYQVRIDNSASESLIPLDAPVTNSTDVTNDTQATLDRNSKLREEHLAQLKALQDDLAAKQDTLDSLQQKQVSLESRLHSMSGPLLLLRETFKTGIFLREKFCGQWQHWLAVREVFRHNQDGLTLDQQGYNRSSLALEDSATTSAPYNEQPSQSVWLQDLELIQKMVEGHHELRPLPLNQIFHHLPSSSSPNSPPTSPHNVSLTAATSIPVSSPREEESVQEVTHSPFLPRSALPDRILLSSSNLKIRPSSDFRCPIKIPQQLSSGILYTLSWDFTLLSLSGSGPATGDSVPVDGSNSSTIDIGFCVLGKSADGSFPMLTPYKRIGPVGANIIGSLSFLLVSETADDNCEGDLGDEVLRIPYTEVILLFDNTYSWFKPKHIRYEISLDCSFTGEPPAPLSEQGGSEVPPAPPVTKEFQQKEALDPGIVSQWPATQPTNESQEESSTAPATHSFPMELLAEMAGASSRILELSDEIHEFCSSVTSLTYK